MSTDWRPTWFAWHWPQGRTWHAAYRTPAGFLFWINNIGFEDKADCDRYILEADLVELTGMSSPAPRTRMDKAEEARWLKDPEPDRDDGPPDDPRFEWIEDQNFAGEQQWIKGGCHHLTPAPVDLSTGELVAWWCPDCGEQFDRDRWPCPENLWTPLPDIVRPPPSASETLTPPATPDDDLMPWTTWAYATFLWVKKTAPVIMIVSIAAVCYMFIMIAEANGLDIP